MRKILLLLAVMVFPVFTQAEISLVDDTGVTVVLEQPAQRIISLAPHITELVYSAGAGEQLVGVVDFSDYPEQARKLPQVGSYKKVSVEVIATLKPDLILAFGSGNGWEMINHLRQLGFTVFVDEPKTLVDIADSIQEIGVLTGNEAQAKEQADTFMQQVTALQQTYSDKKPVDAFYQVWNSPLMTVNDKHIIADVIRLCGGKNVFHDALPLVPKTSVENIVQRNPAIIIASGMAEERPEWLDDWQQWPAIKAVKNQQLYFIHPDLLQRHTLRIVQGAQQMCEHIDQARQVVN